MKIAVIGGAGVRTVIFINGLLARYKALHIDEVALYDINQEKQQIITKLCRHVVNRNHKDLIVTESADVRKVLPGRGLCGNNAARRRRPFPCYG